MSIQLCLRDLFRNQFFSPRNGFVARAWQSDCLEEFLDQLHHHRATFGATPDVDGRPAPQFRFTIYAGTGSGKTKAAALIAAALLNDKSIEQVVIICPNRAIKRKTHRDFAEFFGIDLVFAKNGFKAQYGRGGIGRGIQGYILTYGHMMNQPALHYRLCSLAPTLVVFDEVHHLGDREDKKWSDSATKAFRDVPFVLCLTGTPYRSDNVRIPYVVYEETDRGGLWRFKADPESRTGFTYSLGRAVADGVCRHPQFFFHDGTVMTRPPGQRGTRTFTFGDTKISLKDSEDRLRGAVQYGAVTRRNMLAEALEICRHEGRKLIIFLGGNTVDDEPPTRDATHYLPLELAELGIGPDEIEIIVSDDEDAQKKIESVGKSSRRIIISINMISEGTDIPELSAAVFLSTYKTKQSIIQRCGRVLRSLGPDDPLKTALIFMFKDPTFVAVADEMLAEVEVEQAVAERRKAEKTPDGGEEPAGNPHRTEAIGIAGGRIETVKLGNRDWPISTIREMQERLRKQGLSASMADTAIRLHLEEMEANIGHGIPS